MDAAKAAVKDFMSKSGHNDTAVHEKVAPAVTRETIERTKHEEVQPVVDREVHQDHFHTSVQPVNESARFAEKHHHNIIPVEQRTFDHGKNDDAERRLQTESAKFRDERQVVEGGTTSSKAPVVAGEHIHHHVHETIQPVVNKQTIEPHVVHTTVPIHEVHHNTTQHHATTALPAVSMAEFKNQGGALAGREERHDGFQGEPRSIIGEARSGANEISREGTGGLNGASHGISGANTHNGTGLNDTRNTIVSNNTRDTVGSNTRDAAASKPSLMDKMNPKIDADGDGKAGFMS